jgi:hypothetical protein
MTPLDPPGQGPADETPEDAAEDAMLDRLDAGEPAVSPEEQAARAPYERLIAQVREKPAAPVPAGMRDRVRAGWHAARDAERRARRRRIAIGVGTTALLAAAVVVFLWARPEGARGIPSPRMFHLTRDPTGLRKLDHPALGSELEAGGVAVTRYAELRLYRETKLLVQCPQDPRCTGLRLHHTFDAVGNYRLLMLASESPLAPPHPDGYDADVTAARNAGADFEPETFEVTP